MLVPVNHKILLFNKGSGYFASRGKIVFFLCLGSGLGKSSVGLGLGLGLEFGSGFGLVLGLGLFRHLRQNSS